MADEQVKTVRIVIDASKAKDGAADVERALKSIDDKIEALGDSIGHAFSGLKNALLGLVSFDAIQTQIRGLTEAFDRLGTKAQTLGTTTDWLQAFEFALASSTVKIDEGYKALDRFARLVGEGAQGNKAAVETLNQLGIKIYDVNRQVRPITDLFEEASAKIAGTSNAAKQNALAVDAMGKSAQAVIPALQAIGQGSDAMIRAGEKAGAIVNREAVKIWTDLAEAADKNLIKWRSFAGENFAESVKKGFDVISAAISGALGLLGTFRSLLKDLANDAGSAVASANEAAATGLRRNLGMDQRNADIDKALADWRGQYGALETRKYEANLLPTELAQQRLAEARAANQAAAQRYYELQRQQGIAAYKVTNAAIGSPDGLPPPVSRADFGLPPLQDPNRPPPTTGAFGATASDGGAQADRQNKRIQALQAEAAATQRMAEAAKQGAAAVNEEEANFKALQQALEVYGDKAKATDPAVKALADRFKDLNQAIADNKAVTAFRLQTEDLGRQNEVLQKRLDLIDAAPEIVAREIGQLQARNEALKTGAKISEEDIAARGQVAEKQELLNQKLQAAQRLQELWLQPLKSALSSMQQGLAGLFEGLLSGGINSWQQFTDSMKKIWIRMIAELAAASVIRPIIAPIIAGGQGLGLISPQVASQLGYPTAGGGGGGMGALGGGLGSMGGGGLSSMTMPSWLGGGQPFAFLNQPIGGFGGALQGTSPAALAAPHGATGAALGGITWGQGLSALAGAGLGVYNLATSRSTGQTIGGIASLVGAGVSLIPGIGQIAGPAISLLGGLLPGLFGGEQQPTITNQEFGQLAYGAGGFSTSGGAWGPSANAGNLQGPLGNSGARMAAIFQALGGVQDPGKVWGMALQSFSQQYGGGQSFSNQTSFLVGPNGERRQWGMGSNPGDVGLEAGSVQATLNSILGGAVGEISQNMRHVLEGLNDSGKATFDTLGTAVTEIKAFDEALKNVGKTTTAAEQALKSVDDSFAALYATASKYGLDTGELDAARQTARAKVGTDFAADINRQILGISDPTAAAYADVDQQIKTMLDNNAALVDKLAGYEDQKVRIEELGALKRKQIADQVAAAQEAAAKQAAAAQRQAANDLVSAALGSVDKLEAVIRQLSPGGALSNLDPTAQLKGLQASASASYAQAFADPTNAALVERAASDAQALSEFGLKYYAGSTGYVSLRDQQLSNAQQLQAAVTNGAAGTLPGQIAGNDQLAPLLTMMAQLLTAIQQNTNDNSQRDAEIARLMSQMTRLLARPAA